jgi:hypothetical protein
MATITTRAGKGSPLTNTEVDDNFSNLNSAKYESGANPTFAEHVYLTPSDSNGTNTTQIAIGHNRAGDGYAHLDFVGDATYSDYGLRILRGNGGENAFSQITHRGTNKFYINMPEGGSEFVLNEGSYDTDFRVESNDNTHMLFVDASTNNVGIGAGASPLARLHVNGGNISVGDNAGKPWIGYHHGVDFGGDSSPDYGWGSVSARVDYVSFSSNFYINASSVDKIANSHSSGRKALEFYMTAGHMAFRRSVNAGTAKDTTVTSWETPFAMYDSADGNVFNETGLNKDFRVESENNYNMIRVDASADSVGIGKVPDSAYALDVDGVIRQGTGVVAGKVYPYQTLINRALNDPTRWYKIYSVASASSRVLGLKIQATGDNSNFIGEFTINLAGYGFKHSIKLENYTYYNGAQLLDIATRIAADNVTLEIYAQVDPLTAYAGSLIVNCTDDNIITPTIVSEPSGLNARLHSRHFPSGANRTTSAMTSSLNLSNGAKLNFYRDADTRSGSLFHNNSGTVLRTNDNGDNLYLQAGGTGSVYLQPTIDGYATIVNEDSMDSDFRVESNDHTSMLHVDAFQNRVGLKIGAPQATLDVAGPIIAGAAGATGGGMLIAHRYGGGEFYDSDFLGSIGSEYSSGHLVIGYGARAAKSLAESNAAHRMYSTYDNFSGQKQLIVVGQHETVFNFSDAAATDTVEDAIDSHNSFEVHRNYVLVNQDSRGDVDFRVESNDNAYMLFVDASTNRVGVGSSANSTFTVSNTADTDGGMIADFVGHDTNQRLIVANFKCGDDEDRVGLIWENQGSILLRQWMASTGQLYVSGSNPANQTDGDRLIKDQANVGGTGDRGIQIPNGDRIGFDQTGTRSWTMKATGGNLTVNSGDGNGRYDVNMDLYTSKSLQVNGTTHQLGEYSSALACTYLRSEYFVRGLRGEVLKTYTGHQISWNTSTETKAIFEVSHDSANWGGKFIIIEVFQTMFGGGGYSKYYLRHQYNSQDLYLISQNGSDAISNTSMTGLTTVSGNVKKSSFQITMGYYQHAIVRVSSNMTAVSSITGQDQLHFF